MGLPELSHRKGRNLGMTVLVDHTARRNAILERAFELFAREGFAGVTYQKIASRCGISRTTIYKYFRDKEQIFNFAVRQATDKMSGLVAKVVDRDDLSPVEKIRRVLHLTLKLLSENRVFLTVVLDYLITQKASGGDVRKKVRRNTFGMRIVLSRLIQDGIRLGLLRKIDSDSAAWHLYSLLESYVLNLTVIDAMDWRGSLALFV